MADFYRDYAGDHLHRPSPKELTLAKEVIDAHGVAKGRAIVAAAVRRLKAHWPAAKTFGAVGVYLPEAIADCAKNERLAARAEEASAAEQAAREEESRRAKDKAALRVRWSALPEEERAAIRSAVLAAQPRRVERFPKIIDRLCLEELFRRQGEGL